MHRKIKSQIALWVTTLMPVLGCQSPSVELTPVGVCESVTHALVGYDLPEKIAVVEQEIRDKRIVVHLKFPRPADAYPMQVVCVYAANRYQQDNTANPYHKMPTRLAINSQQVAEEKLLEAISQTGLQ